MLSLVRISPRTEGKDSNYFYNNKKISCFSIKKAQDFSRVLEFVTQRDCSICALLWMLFRVSLAKVTLRIASENRRFLQ